MLSVVLGPANTTPERARWVFTFRVSASDQQRGNTKKRGEEAIGKGSRGMMWYEGKPFPRFQHAVDVEQCNVSDHDLKTVSIVLRTFTEEKDPNALLYVRPRNHGPGHFKIIQGHHYYLNITL